MRGRMLRSKVDRVVADPSLLVVLGLHFAEGLGSVGVWAVHVNVNGDEMGAFVGRSRVWYGRILSSS